MGARPARRFVLALVRARHVRPSLRRARPWKYTAPPGQGDVQARQVVPSAAATASARPSCWSFCNPAAICSSAYFIIGAGRPR